MATSSLESVSSAGLIDWCRAAVDDALRAFVDEQVRGSLRIVAGYHLGWLSSEGHALERGMAGKAIRPVLALLVSRAVASEPGMAIPAAVAVELLHNYSLLHDDVMDGDEMRRHRPAAWTVFGTSNAVLAGNVLLSLSLRCAADLGLAAVDLLTETSVNLCTGQSLDLEFERRADVSLAECEDMAALKTGSLIAASCGLGALAAGAGRAETAEIRQFGAHLGIAFQVMDDLAGIWGSSDRTGKPCYSDLASRKKSLPVVAALCSDSSAGEEFSVLYRRPSEPTEDLAGLAALVDRAGGRDWAFQRVAKEIDSALGCLARVDLDPALSAPLELVARQVGDRRSLS